MNLLDLFEEMDNAYTDFCKKATKFMDEAKLKTQPDYKSWVGKLCWFWDQKDDGDKCIGFLKSYNADAGYPFIKNNGTTWKNCRPLTREEVEQYLVKEN